MSWQRVGGVVFILFGVAGIAAGLMQFGIMGYYHVVHGPIEVSQGEHESLDDIALVWQNVVRACCMLLAGVAAGAAAIAWFKEHNRAGLILAAAAFVLMGATTVFRVHN